MELSVIGLGKLGAPLALILATKGHAVKGVDFNVDIVQSLNSRKAPFYEPQLQDLLDKKSLDFEATTDYELAIHESDATFIIVPTPSEANGLFSNRYILQAIEEIGKAIKKKKKYHLVVITSTVIPGSTDGVIRQALEQFSEREVGDELGLCYNPEFIALGSVVQDMLYPDMILIGESDPKAGEMLQSIYETFCENKPPIQRMNCVNAELTKLSLNTFVTTKISYANMLGAVCDALPDSDIDVVTQAIGLDSRIGSKYLKAAVAFGGPCFPRDNIAFRSIAQCLNVPVTLAEATQAVNDFQEDRLQTLIKKYEKGKRIGILGLSYKPGTYIIEESAGLKLANRLQQEGYQVSVYDPLALTEAKKALVKTIDLASSVEDCLAKIDMALIMTNWPEFSKKITPNRLKDLNSCKVIIDCWRMLDKTQFKEFCQIVYLGQGCSSKMEQSSNQLLTV